MRSRSANVFANRSRSSNNARTLRKMARVRLVDSPRGSTNVRMADIRVVRMSTTPATATSRRRAITMWTELLCRPDSDQRLGQLTPLPLWHRPEIGLQDLDADV